jgi:hypothetical protein
VVHEYSGPIFEWRSKTEAESEKISIEHNRLMEQVKKLNDAVFY